ncbi:MAG TPA: prepilin peptidase [Hyphomicrobium sp.]|nr:prepilin peptidase [Hyphomonadaceae bacterium]HPG89141.1 prepilin peptidase [Hyphomicrobium sp.]HPN06946.1 prepilin peptidase [Hyphomonadaceae bacterium]
MITTLLCLAFPLLLIYAAWHDVSTMTIPNWVSIVLGLAFIPAAFAAGLSVEQIGLHLVFGAGVLILCAALFYLNVFGGGDAKVIAAASLWTGLAASAPFVMGMAIAGGALAGVLIVLRRMKVQSDKPWLARLMSPEEGAPYAVAIAVGALLAAPSSPVLAAGLAGISA